MLKYEVSTTDETDTCLSAQPHLKKIEVNGRTVVAVMNRTLLFR
ncbi:hypothetical protein HDC90_000222 [Pedobacter sp. AK013]|nr:hypothetical protein [Pedobacter sp. AK013]MBB6235625.1 hypothetical protein [Pedobacter sp. AK013]